MLAEDRISQQKNIPQLFKRIGAHEKSYFSNIQAPECRHIVLYRGGVQPTYRAHGDGAKYGWDKKQ